MAVAKMKRVFIVGFSDDKEKVVRFLQEAGVLHVEPIVKLTGEVEKQNTLITQDVRRIAQAYESMKGYGKGKQKDSMPYSDGEILARCERTLENLQEVRNRKEVLEKIISDLDVWGDFNTDYLTALENENVFVQRFKAEGVPTAELNVPDDVFIEIVSEKPILQFFTIRMEQPVELPWATLLRNPEVGLRKAQEELDLLKRREVEVVAELSALADGIEALKGFYLGALNEASYTECLGTLYSEGLLIGLQGWVPAYEEKVLLDRFHASGLTILVTTRDPLDEEMPPTLLKNNWFVKRIEPLLKLYGLPRYRDLDPSYFFAPFMVFFFGICLGDAGYGAVFLVSSIWIRKRFGHISPALPVVMRLCEAFSILAIVVGLITGSVFGYWPFTRDMIAVDIDKDHGNPMILFYTSLGIGLLHLSISYILGMYQSFSSYERFQRLGTLCVLWGGSALVVRQVWFSKPEMTINNWFYYGGMGLLVGGLMLSLIFASDSRKILTRLGLGLWNVYGMTGLIGDLLSYARLFGLGIASTAIASVMNNLAGMVYEATGAVAGSLLGFLILVFGHSFNFLLAVLGSTIHSARLHFVEAFRSFFSGGGVEYKPFKIERGKL